MKKLIFISLTVLQSYSPLLLSQDLQFYREDIVFRTSSDSMDVDAVYYFVNVGEKNINTMLYYPFPENTRSLIDSISIADAQTGQTIEYIDGTWGVNFNIIVPSYGQASRHVFFRQKIQDNYFKYILTSTSTWGRALEFANFVLQVPVNLSVDSLSYTPDTSYIKDETRYYYWKKMDFMPEKDFEVHFKNP